MKNLQMKPANECTCDGAPDAGHDANYGCTCVTCCESSALEFNQYIRKHNEAKKTAQDIFEELTEE